MKELPEKWCIKNCPEVGKWFEEQTSENNTYTKSNLTCYLHNYSNDINIFDYKKLKPNHLAFTGLTPKDGYIEITFEEFERFILNKNYDEDMNYLISILQKYNIK